MKQLTRQIHTGCCRSGGFLPLQEPQCCRAAAELLFSHRGENSFMLSRPQHNKVSIVSPSLGSHIWQPHDTKLQPTRNSLLQLKHCLTGFWRLKIGILLCITLYALDAICLHGTAFCPVFLTSGQWPSVVGPFFWKGEGYI